MKDPTRSKELADLARDLGIDPAKCAELCARAEPFLSIAAAPCYSFRALVPLLYCVAAPEMSIWFGPSRIWRRRRCQSTGAAPSLFQNILHAHIPSELTAE